MHTIGDEAHACQHRGQYDTGRPAISVFGLLNSMILLNLLQLLYYLRCLSLHKKILSAISQKYSFFLKSEE